MRCFLKQGFCFKRKEGKFPSYPSVPFSLVVAMLQDELSLTDFWGAFKLQLSALIRGHKMIPGGGQTIPFLEVLARAVRQRKRSAA